MAITQPNPAKRPRLASAGDPLPHDQTVQLSAMALSPQVFTLPMDIATVQVNSVTFKVHKQLLVLNSPYFEKALNGPFSEASKQEVVIDDVSDTVFAAYVDVIYRSFFCATFRLCTSEVGRKMPLIDTLSLWQMADRFLNAHVANMVRDTVDTYLTLYCTITWAHKYRDNSKEVTERHMLSLQWAYNKCIKEEIPFSANIVKAAANCPPQAYQDCVHLMQPKFMAEVSQLMIMAHADPAFNRVEQPNSNPTASSGA